MYRYSSIGCVYAKDTHPLDNIACAANTCCAAAKKTTTCVNDWLFIGCYYKYQHYAEGQQISTSEPCLNCTCHNQMLMCYLNVCPYIKPMDKNCVMEKKEDECCPTIQCSQGAPRGGEAKQVLVNRTATLLKTDRTIKSLVVTLTGEGESKCFTT